MNHRPALLELLGPEEFERRVCPLDVTRQRYWAWTSWQVVLQAVAFGLGQVIWTRSIHFLGGTRTTVYGNVVPVVGVVAAALFLDERMTSLQMIGGAAVLVGVVLTQRGHHSIEEPREI